MAVMQMQKVTICALNKYRKNILEGLQEFGFMEIDEVMDPEGEFSRMDTSLDRSRMTKEVAQAERALEILELYAPRKKEAFEGFMGKAVIDEDIYVAGARRQSELTALADKLVDLDRDIVAYKANIAKLENQIEELTPWLKLDVPMDTEGSKKTAFFVGTISESITERQLEEKLSQACPEVTNYSVTAVSSSQDMTYFAVMVFKSEEKALEDALRKLGFSRPSSLVPGVPSESKAAMEKEIESDKKEIETLTGEISALSDKWRDLRLFSDYCRIRAKKYEILGSIPQTKNVFALEGFIPKEYVPGVSSELTEKFDAIVEARDLRDDEEGPVLFKNKWFGSVGEGTVESFGLPNKREIDPSSIMMVFYVIFFGLMLSDAAYGALLSLGTGIMLLKFPKMSPGMKNLLQLFFLCGFSTLFWGVMFGGYFGDAVDVIARTFLGVELAEGQSIIPAAWFVPINNPMRMLIYSLLFGLIHMYTGLVLSIYQSIKNKAIPSMLSTIGTGLFVLGLILILLPTDLFEGIAQMEFNFPPIVGTLSKVSLIGGLVLILGFSSDSPNLVLRPLLGLYEVYNTVTGWLSDTLSYSRLLALGLATGVIAQVFNQLGSMFGSSLFGTLMFIIIFIIGHVFNLAINVLGAYVHTCRLQYVEFFGKFYEGGGAKFKPYFAETKYVDVKGGH